MQAFGMPRISRAAARAALIILLEGETIRNVFLQTKMVQDTPWGVRLHSKILLEDTGMLSHK